MDIIITLLIVGIIAWLMYEATIAIYHKNLRYETFFANAIVYKKAYEEPYTTYIWTGKVMIPQFHDCRYNVYITYDGEEHCFDDEDLYQKVNVGELIKVQVHKGYNKRNEVKHIYLTVN